MQRLSTAALQNLRAFRLAAKDTVEEQRLARFIPYAERLGRRLERFLETVRIVGVCQREELFRIHRNPTIRRAVLLGPPISCRHRSRRDAGGPSESLARSCAGRIRRNCELAGG